MTAVIQRFYFQGLIRVYSCPLAISRIMQGEPRDPRVQQKTGRFITPRQPLRFRALGQAQGARRVSPPNSESTRRVGSGDPQPMPLQAVFGANAIARPHILPPHRSFRTIIFPIKKVVPRKELKAARINRNPFRRSRRIQNGFNHETTRPDCLRRCHDLAWHHHRKLRPLVL